MIIALEKIWFYTKKLFWLLFLVAGLIFVAKALRGKDKRKVEIEQKIQEVEKIEIKTAEDQKKLEALQKEKKQVEQELVDIAKEYQKKLEKIKEKPPESPKPGDAAASSDAMNNVWK